MRVVVALGGNALLRRGGGGMAAIGALAEAEAVLAGSAGTLVTPR
jgi:carbamate kinase